LGQTLQTIRPRIPPPLKVTRMTEFKPCVETANFMKLLGIQLTEDFEPEYWLVQLDDYFKKKEAMRNSGFGGSGGGSRRTT
jgi:hypothetical protein